MNAFLVTILFIKLFMLTSVEAQTKVDATIGLGISAPMGPEEFKDGWGTGISVAGGLGFFISPQLSLGFSLAFHTFGLETGHLNPGVSVSGGRFEIFEALGVVKHYLHPKARLQVYTLGNIGLGQIGLTDLSVVGSGTPIRQRGESKSYFLLGGGIGIAFPVSSGGAHLFIEGRLGLIFSEGDNILFLPLQLGLSSIPIR